MKKTFVCLFILICSVLLHAQTKWELKKDKDGIRIYSASAEHSDLKMVRVNCTVHGSLSQLTALLMDAGAHDQWVYNTRTSYLVQQINDHHQIYYTETSLPWPMANRDAIVDMTFQQDPVTRVLKVNSYSVASGVPVKKGIVRVPMSKINWTITPGNNQELVIDYVARIDPGGSLPSWLVNAFLTKGPLETFKKLKELVASASYQHVQYAFIQN